MPYPALTNRWNYWQRRRQCGACNCTGSCTLKVQSVGLGATTWCVESFSCDTACNCYCFTRSGDGTLVNNCPSTGLEPIGLIRNGICLKCSPLSPSRHNKCAGGTQCGGFCAFRFDGGIYALFAAGCKPNNVACSCPPAPDPASGTFIGEMRLVGPCS